WQWISVLRDSPNSLVVGVRNNGEPISTTVRHAGRTLFDHNLVAISLVNIGVSTLHFQHCKLITAVAELNAAYKLIDQPRRSWYVS
ncbi:hypothetical protein COCCADRAFT_82109, partial [Bipolaris zeicola 26-R-13]